jgi:predicted ATPase
LTLDGGLTVFDLREGEKLAALHWSINDSDDGNSGVWYFATKSTLGFEMSLREAVKDHLEQHPHKELWSWNWGDAITDILPITWERHGLRLLDEPRPSVDIYVDHDEPLARNSR